MLLAELVREAAIRRTFQELPHAVEAIVEEIEHPRDGLVRVRALMWVESESQKGIVVGAGGRMIKAIGSAARKEIERELDCHVHLDLSVRVRRDWRGDEGCSTGWGSRESRIGWGPCDPARLRSCARAGRLAQRTAIEIASPETNARGIVSTTGADAICKRWRRKRAICACWTRARSLRRARHSAAELRLAPAPSRRPCCAQRDRLSSSSR